MLARVYAKQDRTREAEALLQDMPADDDRVAEQRAALLAQQGRWAGAAELLHSHPFRPQLVARSLLDLYREVHLGWGVEAERHGDLPVAATRFAAAAEPPARLGADGSGGRPRARLLAFQQRWELAAAEIASPGADRACVETRFSWLEIKRDHDPLQSSGVSIFAESPVRESAELAFLI